MPLFDSNDRIRGSIGVLVDITKLKEAQDKIAGLAAILDSSTDAIIGKTLEGIIVSWNPGAEALYGYSDNEAIGRSISFLLAPDHPDDILIILEKIRRGETIASYDTVRMRKDGSLVDVALTVSPVRDSTGKIVGASTVAREMHDELGHALTALKMDLFAMKKKLATNQGIETLPELVEADLKLVNTTLKTVKRLCTELRPSILDHLGLGAAIEWQAQEFQKRSGIGCEVNLVPSDTTFDGDFSSALFRIFQESLTNVLRHAKATKVMTTLSDQGGSIILEIADNGIGITNEHLSKPNSFGLMGMRERVQSCNGEIRIAGSQNAGTTITVIVPKVIAKHSQEQLA